MAAADAAFASEGYAQASLRGIAQRAGVDPALVHHYFDGKAALFVEVTGLPRDFREIRDEVDRATGSRGTALVDRFLRYWDEEPPEGRANSFLSLMQAISSSPRAAESFKQFLIDRIWSQVARDPDDPDWLVRRALIGSQLVGVAFQRYVLRLEPLASAEPAEVAQWVGPTIDRYMAGPLEVAPPAPDRSRHSGRARPRQRGR
ncbi:MAG TPA: TetR family transcriptional regulator [Acidimicrobiales bacterium]|nr:TetR family transcriptional regulator [Acidimicrobiales bacterium]